MFGVSIFNVRANSFIKSICDWGYGMPPSLSHFAICARSGSPAIKTGLPDSKQKIIIIIK